MAGPDERLRAFLGVDPPDSVLALALEDRTALADLLDDARTRQSRALDESFAATLKHVPFPVRGVVKRVLLG